MSPTTRVLAVVAIMILGLLAFGTHLSSLVLAKTLVFFAILYLLVIAYKTLQYEWLVFFFVSSILLNPLISPVTLSHSWWRLVDVVVALGIALFYYRYDDGYRKGAQFENFVCSLFPSELWIIEDRTKDWSKKLKRPVESDQEPDLRLRNKKSNERIAVECKFRTRLWQMDGVSGITWPKKYGDRYRSYAKDKNVPVYIALGLGGNPRNPKKLFLAPLEKLEQYEEGIIPAQYLWQFERNTKERVERV